MTSQDHITRPRDVILLVDDDSTNLSMLRETLKHGRYRLLMAKSGEQAQAVALKTQPALVLLDIIMPGIDGFETCRRLKADPRTADSAIIFLSSLDDARDKVRGLELGAVDFVSKPFHPEEVIARVETHLKIRHLEQTLLRKNQALEQANSRMRDSLQAAARVQHSFLPERVPAFEGVRLEWRYRPCEELAGDYLNVVALSPEQLGLFVVDICGHGVPSSLLAVQVARDLISSGRESLLVGAEDGTVISPCEVAARLNAKYPAAANAGLYFTFLYALLDTRSRELRFVSAGNPGPVHVDANGAVRTHDVPAFPIGLFEEGDYHDTVLPLRPGDRVYLHSDGLTEVRGDGGELFGIDRLQEVLLRERDSDLAASLDTVLANVVDWHGSDAFADDIAVVALELKEPP